MRRLLQYVPMNIVLMASEENLMIDIKFLRENPEIVKQNIINKFQHSKLPLVDEVIKLDEEYRNILHEADSLRGNRNKISKQIGALMAQGKKEEAEIVKAEVAKQGERLAECEKLEAELSEEIRKKPSGFGTFLGNLFQGHHRPSQP